MTHDTKHMLSLKFLLWGGLAALASLFLELIFFIVSTLFRNISIFTDMAAFSAEAITPFFFFIPIIEESVKYLVLTRQYSLQLAPEKFLRLSLLFGAGFGGTEIALASFVPSFWETSADALGILFLHTVTAGFMASFLRSQQPKKFSLILGVIGFTALIHILYNLAVFSSSAIFQTGLLLFFIILSSFFFFRPNSPPRRSLAE